MNHNLQQEISFGEWLRQRRRLLDLTQQELAEQVGCARITLRRIEAGALKPSKELAQILLEKLGVPPNEREAWLPFARGRSGFPESSVDSLLGKSKTNLPISLTSFIGRDKELREIVNLLEKYRLLTLIGPGGVGKTRLSIQAALQVLENYSDGVWLVELAPILDPILVPRTIAIAIGLVDEPQRPIIDMLCDYLHTKKILIIFDNCEHLVDACAHIAERILQTTPNVCIIASSREALGIAGEVAYQVPSLSLPNLKHLPPLPSLSQYEAIQLFIERATASVSNFTITNENAPTLAQVCYRLDGIPFAIELAAAKVRVLSLEEINERLDDRFHLLTGGSRTVLPRHQTLQAAIEWSYDLLSLTERTLFRRLSVFVNGWTLEASESVCSDESIKTEDILNLLSQLINKSLVNREESQVVTRYRMLETIRQYANERLGESSESIILRDQHLDYFLNLAETAEPHLRKKQQIKWLKRLDAEHDNIRAALAWGMRKPVAEPILRLAGALGSFWHIRNDWLEGAKWLDQTLEKEWNETSKLEKAARAKILYRRADLAYEMDELEKLKACAESALQLCQEVKNPWGVAYSRTMIAEYLNQTGNYEFSKSLYEQSLLEFQKLNDAWGQSFVLRLLLRLLTRVGKQEQYLENRQRAIVLARASGDRYLLADLLAGYASELTFLDGAWDQAEKLMREVEQLFLEIDSSESNWIYTYRTYSCFVYGKLEEAKTVAKSGIEYCHRIGENTSCALYLIFLGLIAEIENDLQSAIEYQQESLNLFSAIGSPRQIAWALMILGRLRYQASDYEVALPLMQASLEMVKKGNISQGKTAYIFCHLGGFFVENKPQVAVQILGLNEKLSQNLPHPRDPIFDKPFFDRFLAVARGKLSKPEFTFAWEVGLKMTMDEAIALAFEQTDELK